MGTDLRKLASDGYPAHLLIGCDIRQTFIDQGYQLFNDSPPSCPVKFIVSDIFELRLTKNVVTNSADITSLEDLRGRLSIIYAGALFHLFNEETQFAIALRLILLLRRPQGSDQPKKVILFGRHQGLEEEGMIPDWMGRYVPLALENTSVRIFSDL